MKIYASYLSCSIFERFMIKYLGQLQDWKKKYFMVNNDKKHA